MLSAFKTIMHRSRCGPLPHGRSTVLLGARSLLLRGAYCVVCVLLAAATARTATITVQPRSLDPGGVAPLIVEGSTSNEFVFGVTILLEIVPRAGNIGFVRFTQAPPTDIGFAGDPWPGVGTFTPFDTDLTGSLVLNGSVDDNGTFVPSLLTYSGLLAGYPVVASVNASGTWDVLLSTSAGDSRWETIPTNLQAGTITVVNTTNIPAASEWGVVVMAMLFAVAGTIAVLRQR